MSKKDEIVRAAIQAFGEKGIEKTKISDIVQLAGVAQGTYYLYFPSKLSVMPAIAEVMVEKMIAILKKMVKVDAPLSKKLEQMIEAIFLVTRDYREIHALIYAGLASTDHIKKWEAVYEPVYKWVSDLLRAAKTEKLIRQSINIKPTSKLIIGLVESAAEQVYLYDTIREEQALEQKEEVHQFLLHSLQIKS